MNFKLTKEEVIKLTGKKDFTKNYFNEVKEYYRKLRNNEESIWDYLEIEEI